MKKTILYALLAFLIGIGIFVWKGSILGSGVLMNSIFINYRIFKTIGSEKIKARVLVDFNEFYKGVKLDSVPSFGVGFDGAILSCAKMTPGDPWSSSSDYEIIRWKDGQIKKLLLSRLSVSYPRIQSTAKGILIVDSRIGRGLSDKNGHFFDWDGKEKGRITLGDGIQDVRVTPNGKIWVSYFDEGVFCNRVWGNPPMAVESTGLASFFPSGALSFSYDPKAAGTDSIADAYAINVAGDEDVWLYFYTEFPIVHFSHGQYRAWKFGGSGANALAVKDQKVLLYGDYGNPQLCRILHLGDNGNAKVIKNLKVEFPEGYPPGRSSGFGIGEKLYIFENLRVLCVDNWWVGS